ncbi:RNA polymerase II holoenzyme/mediator subunit [Cerrena zonata]|uniref:RNA polymerase II holoenzyme/mediator subunit n=1 Tax=Cerrena zonata TaxID=2478898 RepID=A0AAW0GCM7_9APHY
MVAQAPDIIKEIDPQLLAQALKFDKTPIKGIPGFNTADLAINDQQTLMRTDDMSENDEYGGKKSKRKKKIQANGGDHQFQVLRSIQQNQITLHGLQSLVPFFGEDQQ